MKTNLIETEIGYVEYKEGMDLGQSKPALRGLKGIKRMNKFKSDHEWAEWVTKTLKADELCRILSDWRVAEAIARNIARESITASHPAPAVQTALGFRLQQQEKD